jgi:hypothetical protein
MQEITVPYVPPILIAAGTNYSKLHRPLLLTLSKLFPLAKPLAHNMSHAYSPIKPSQLSRILILATFPENTAAAVAMAEAEAEPQKTSAAVLILSSGPPNPHLSHGTNAFVFRITSAPIFKPLQPLLPPPPLAPAPTTITQATAAPLCMDMMSNTAGSQH